jgi:hypothetical protein
MQKLPPKWAWLFAIALWSGTVGRAEEISPPAGSLSEQEPARLEYGSSEPTTIGIRPVDPADYWQRLERAEAQIAELQAQNQSLRESQSPILQTGFNPLHLAPLFTAHDPEIGIIREQTSSTSGLMELPTDLSKPEAPKPKKWYDKLSIRGYVQVRINELTRLDEGSTRPQYVGDRSVSDNQNFLIRRARVILSGDVHERLYVYLQPDFAVGLSSVTTESNQFAQIRDWYGDFYLDDEKEYRIRVGQSKVPYGWENMQSSSNRLPLDRADSLNSAVRNERDLGIYFFYTPTWAQDFFKEVLEKGYKGSGNYGLFSAGIYNGQGGSLNEINDDVHFFSRLTLPLILENGQHVEFAIQGYTGEYAVIGSTIDPDGAGGAGPAIPEGTVAVSGAGIGANAASDRDGWNDRRIAGTFVWYPQPFGFQTEWTVGRGPALNAAQTAIEERSLYGGYAMLLYKLDTECWGTWFPYVRYSYFKGGYKSERNAPFSRIDEWEFGTEWQINPSAELTLAYLITDRTNTVANSAAGSLSYGQFDGQVIRLQFQLNY